MRVVLALICCLLVLPSWAEETTVYKRVRPDGTVEFSDEPTPGGKAIEVPPLPTYPTTPLPTTPAPRATPNAPAGPAQVKYERITVREPANDATVFFDEAGMSVSVAVAPGLQPGHSVALFLDGRKVASGTADRYILKDVFRGTHTLTAVVQDSAGRDLVRSSPTTFHMVQHTQRP